MRPRENGQGATCMVNTPEDFGGAKRGRNALVLKIFLWKNN
jgi:hypothetical protein